MKLRTCNKCGHTGPLETDFPTNKAYAEGYRPQCKPCHNAAARQWQKDNPDKFAAIRNTYLERNGKDIRARVREKFQANPVANEKKNAGTRAWRERMRAEGKMKDITFRYSLVKYGGLTPDQYREMLNKQGGGCAICKGSNPKGKRLAVDHDHKCCPGRKSCGKCIRGLVCDRCNHMLGHAKDSPGVLQAAIAYLTF